MDGGGDNNADACVGDPTPIAVVLVVGDIIGPDVATGAAALGRETVASGWWWWWYGCGKCGRCGCSRGSQ